MPYRVAAAVASLPVSSARRRVVEWTVRVDALPKLEGVVLWIGVLHDSRGSVVGDGDGSRSPRPRRLRNCRCSVAPHDVRLGLGLGSGIGLGFANG